MKALKQITVLFTICLLFAKTLAVPFLFLDFELRKDFIIQNFCENKNRPELNCDGQCYLAKQLKENQENDEKQATDRFLSKLYQMEHIESKRNLGLSRTSEVRYFEQHFIPKFQSLYARSVSKTLFQPPRS